ncbi:MAG: hypothetical protein ACK527_14305 [Acidobacteriota bacterium]
MRVPRGPDAEVPVHGGDHPAIAVPTTSGSTSRPRTRSRGKAAPAKYTSRAPRCAYDRIPKVARIIADLDKREQIETQPLAEAARCRGLDRSYWNCTWNRAGAGSTRSSASQAQIPGGVRVLDRVPGRTMVRMAAQRRAAGARTERSRIGPPRRMSCRRSKRQACAEGGVAARSVDAGAVEAVVAVRQVGDASV